MASEHRDEQELGPVSPLLPSANETYESETVSSLAEFSEHKPEENQTTEQSRPSGNSKPPHIHWTAPMGILTGLILGIALAVGHHYYYHHFNGRIVGSKSQQQWITRGGSAFGFAVKTLFAFAAGTAYAQQLWLSLQGRAASISKVDSMFSVLSNPFQFLDLRLWFGRSVLLIPALVTWFVPLIAIVAPGTLTVEPGLQQQTMRMRVPQIDFDNSDYVIWGYEDAFSSASDTVAQIAISTSAQGSLLSILPPAANSSYATTFYGPAISCVPANRTAVSALENASSIIVGGGQQVLYAAWVAGFTFNLTSPNLEPANASVLGGGNYAIDQYSEDFARLFVYNYDPLFAFTCGLFNRSYSASFNFSSGDQQVTVHTSENLNGVSFSQFPEVESVAGVNLTNPGPAAAYIALMEALGRILVGSIVSGDPGDDTEAPVLTSIRDTKLNDLREGPNHTIFGGAIEQLFENITISLLSNTSFQLSQDESTPVDVATSLTENIYAYHPRDLLLAYTLGALATLVCLAIGMSAIFRNHSAHSNSFSAILRATRNPDLDSLISDAETGGAEPLPKGLGETIVRLRKSNGGKGFEVVSLGKSTGSKRFVD